MCRLCAIKISHLSSESYSCWEIARIFSGLLAVCRILWLYRQQRSDARLIPLYVRLRPWNYKPSHISIGLWFMILRWDFYYVCETASKSLFCQNLFLTSIYLSYVFRFALGGYCWERLLRHSMITTSKWALKSLRGNKVTQSVWHSTYERWSTCDSPNRKL